MKTLKKHLSYFPESILLLLYSSWIIEVLVNQTLNFPMLFASLLIGVLLIWKNKFLALILAIILGAGSLYMVLAVVSEYQEFPAGDPNGIKLLLTGCTIFLFFGIIAFLMPLKYFKNNRQTK